MIPFSAASSSARRPGVGSVGHRAPTEDCSDSDGDDSRVGEERAVFSPVPCGQLSTIVVFGADGNLAKKKILPTIFKLWKTKMVPRDLLVIGFARSAMSTAEFRKLVFKCIYDPRQTNLERKEFQGCCHYASGQFNDVDAIRGLTTLAEQEEERRAKTRGAPSDARTVRMYYMAVPPFLYADICFALRACRAERTGSGADAVLTASQPPIGPALGWPVERFVLEKPFGRDTESCAALFAQLSMLSEEEIYRIDHYLGKELVLNLLVLR